MLDATLEEIEATWNIDKNFERCGHASGIYAIKSEQKMIDLLGQLLKDHPDDANIKKFVSEFERNTAIYNSPGESGFYVYKNRMDSEFRIAVPDSNLNYGNGFKHYISDLDIDELETLSDLCQKRVKEKMEEHLQPVLALMYDGELIRAFMPHERNQAEAELEKMILNDFKERKERGYKISQVNAKIEERRVRMSEWSCYFGHQ